MAEQVGGIYFDVALETGQMVRDSKVADQQIGKLEASLNELSRAVQTHIAETRQESQAMKEAGAAAKKQGADQKAAAEAAAAARRYCFGSSRRHARSCAPGVS